MEQHGSAAKMIFLICMAGVFVCCALLYLSPRVYLIKLGYTLERLAMEQRQLWEEQQSLRLEASSLRALDRVEAWAREQGEMVFFKREQVVYVVREELPERWGK